MARATLGYFEIDLPDFVYIAIFGICDILSRFPFGISHVRRQNASVKELCKITIHNLYIYNMNGIMVYSHQNCTWKFCCNFISWLQTFAIFRRPVFDGYFLCPGFSPVHPVLSSVIQNFLQTQSLSIVCRGRIYTRNAPPSANLRTGRGSAPSLGDMFYIIIYFTKLALMYNTDILLCKQESFWKYFSTINKKTYVIQKNPQIYFIDASISWSKIFPI